MLNWINRKMKRKGFTLIEMVIVIAILGILIAIAVPRLSGFRDSAAERADEATAETIERAANLYVAEYGEKGAEKLCGEQTELDSGEATLTEDEIQGFIDTLRNAKLIDGDSGEKLELQSGGNLEIKYSNGEFTVELVEDQSNSETDETDEQ